MSESDSLLDLRWAADLAEAERAGHWVVQGSPLRGKIASLPWLRAQGTFVGRNDGWRIADPRAYCAELGAMATQMGSTNAAIVHQRVAIIMRLLDAGQDGYA